MKRTINLLFFLCCLTDQNSYGHNFLGFECATPFGLAACPAGRSEGIAWYALNGCTILTYKTIRSQAVDSHPAPNIMPVITCKQLTKDDYLGTIFTEKKDQLHSITWANSYGIDSFAPTETLKDIRKAKKVLNAQQVLIVSIYGSASTTKTLIEDFVNTALLAKDAGADVIEANLSCPNLGTNRLIYEDHALVLALCKALSQQLGTTPLIAKIGFVQDERTLEKLLTVLQKGGARGVVSMNSFAMKPLDHQTHTPTFGTDRSICGISGDAIRTLALAQIEKIASINKEKKLGLWIVGVGGVVHEKHVQEFLEAGADAVLSATGLMLDPYLGMKVTSSLAHKQPSRKTSATTKLEEFGPSFS